MSLVKIGMKVRKKIRKKSLGLYLNDKLTLKLHVTYISMKVPK